MMKNNISPSHPKRIKASGQIILETLFLVLFAFAFLTMLAHLYEKGKKEIELSRVTNQ